MCLVYSYIHIMCIIGSGYSTHAKVYFLIILAESDVFDHDVIFVLK